MKAATGFSAPYIEAEAIENIALLNVAKVTRIEPQNI